MPGCSRSAVDEPRVQLGQPLERHAPGLAREADEPQAARGHHDDLGQLVARARPRRARRAPASPRRRPGARGWPSAPRGRPRCRRRRPRSARRRGRPAPRPRRRRAPRRVPASHAARTRSSSVIAVAVGERRALRLAVVGRARRARRAAARRGSPICDAARSGGRPGAARPACRGARCPSGGRPRRRRGRSSRRRAARRSCRRRRRRPAGRAGRRSPTPAPARTCAGAGSAAARRRGPGARPRGARGRSRRRRAAPVCIDGVGAGEVRGVVAPERSRARAPARCSSSASSAARRPRGCSRGWRRPRAAARGRRSGGARAPAASRGWLVTIARPRSFSHQRKAGMSSLSAVQQPRLARAGLRRPVGLPALEAVGALAQPARHDAARCRRAARAAAPRGRGRRSRGRPRPGTSDAIAPARRAWRRTTLRCHVSSSSMASSAEAAVVMTVMPDRHHDAREPAVDARAGADRGRDGHEPAVEHDRRASQRHHAERQRQAAEGRPHERVERRGDRPR